MIRQEKIKEFVDLFLKHVEEIGIDRHVTVEEGYKFKAVDNFQRNFDLDAKDLASMLDASIAQNNLVVGTWFFPRKMLIIFAKEYESETRLALKHLYDENKPIRERIDDTQKTFDGLMADRNKRLSENGHHFIGIRFLSLMLGYKYPDLYNALKPREWKIFCKFVDDEFESPKGSTEGEKYGIYSKYIDTLRDYIKTIPKIQEIRSLMAKGLSFKDSEYRWTTQDVIFVTAGLLKKKRRPEKTDTSSSGEEIQEIREIESEIKSEKVEYYDFLRDFNFEKIPRSAPHSLGDPHRVNICRIIEKCEEIAWVLPQFQRYFDWTRADIQDLWKSIVNDYYVGSFLLWEASSEPALGVQSIQGINEGIDVCHDDKLKNVEMIILDGQQRVTSLYYAIRAPSFTLKRSGVPLYFYINFHSYFQRGPLQGEIIETHAEKLSKVESFDKMLFPLFELENYITWVKEFKDHIKSQIQEKELSPQEQNDILDKIDKIRDHIQDKLRHIWTGFEIPYIALPRTMELYEVSDIFENINTKGKTLSVFDLLIARLHKYDIRLKEIWDGTLEKYPNIKRYHDKIEKMPIYIFQTLSLLYEKNSSCKKEDILNIYSNIYKNTEQKFEEDWWHISEGINRAINKLENMRDGFGIKDEKSVPFAPMVPILGALLIEVNSRSNQADCYKKINQWYWSSIFTNSYSSSVDTQLTSDFRELKRWFDDDNEIPKTVRNMWRDISARYLNFREVQKSSSAQYRGILSLTALAGAKDFDTSQTLENARENDKDHIFPRSLRLKGIESVLNITWMSDTTNRKIKQAKNPSVYTKEFIRDKYNGNSQDFLKVLKTHFINQVAYDYLRDDKFEEFISEREKTILERIKELVGYDEKKVDSTLITPDTPFSNEIAFIETLKNCTEYIYWLDKYFSEKGLIFLTLLNQAVDKEGVKDIKILMSTDKVTEDFRNLYRRFKEENKNKKGIISELRVIINPQIKSSIHDRFIVSKYKAFNLPSTDVAARGQLSEISESRNRDKLEEIFKEIWQSSKDIITEWCEIKKYITS